MRTPVAAGNWKMNTTLPEARALVEAMLPGLRAVDSVETVLCPPFVSLAAVRDLVAGSNVRVGAQNLFYEKSGAFTGEVSPAMVKDLADLVVLGHSERRQLFGETDEIVGRKIRAAAEAGLEPILCVGEDLSQNEAGETEAVVNRQVRAALQGLSEIPGLIVAYEPIWAIGTGRAAEPEGANRTIALIRSVLADCLGAQLAQATRILYGGSVTPTNFPAFIAQPEIDGALVGGASLKADLFGEIVRQAAQEAGG
ncbi:MAG: triose-phosphate isomerase [Chloroflexi bacterium]|nr:triose-phosphate isomerase [Chloroflexota bacterium]